MIEVKIFEIWYAEKSQDDMKKWIDDNIVDWDNQIKSITQSSYSEENHGQSPVALITIFFEKREKENNE